MSDPTDRRQQLALQHFAQALDRLREVVALPEDRIIRDALIKRFEFTFEAGWKAAYRWLRARSIDVNEGADEVIPQAFKHRLVTDEAGQLIGFVSRNDILRAVAGEPPLDLWSGAVQA